MRLVLKLAFDNLSGNNLLHVNLMDKNIYLKRKDIHIGLETGQILQDLIVKSIVYYQYQQQVNLDKTAGKFIDILLVRNSTPLDPQSIISISKDSLRGKIKTLLHHLVSLKIISHTISEKAF